jgi:TolB-like protein/DNA-binding winged helix-turn-helix (wHTH) protein/tetratricopeptide (TPR) repeat protein
MDVAPRERGIYAFGRYKLDPSRRCLHRDGSEVALTARLFETLLYLVQHPERLIERDELEHAVWHGRAVEGGNLQKAISSLRRVLQDGGAGETYIVTVPGRGFQFCAPVAFEPAESPRPADLTFTHARARRGMRRVWIPVLLGGTVLLLATIGLSWHFVPPASPVAAFTPPPHSVAVLAFANMSGDAHQEYFSDGLADELINTLSRIAGLRVAARTSAFSFKGGTATISDIARRLNVAAILEGSVRLDGPRAHIAVQLIDTRSGFQFWSRSYDQDRRSGDMLQVRTDIAQAVAGSLEMRLGDGDAAKLTVGATHDPRAFDAYLRGMADNQDFDDARARNALGDFDDAIRIDPNYAQAFAGRAVAHNFLAIASYGVDARQDRQEAAAALADANRAIELAPMLAEAHRVRGAILFSKLDFIAAANEIARASELAPDSAIIEATRGTIEARFAHAATALQAARHAISLDPLNPSAYRRLGLVLYWTRQFGAAIEAFGHAAAVDEHVSRVSLSLPASAYLAQGRPAEAAHICEGGQEWTDQVCLAMAYHALGRQKEAEAQFAELHKALGDRAAYVSCEITSQWGQREEALRWLKTAYALRDSGLADMKVSPFLDPLRGTETFKAIETALAFPP